MANENHPQEKKLNSVLSDAIDSYEQRTGFDALNWRSLRRNTREPSLQRQVDAVRADMRWFELYSQEVQSGLGRAISTVLMDNTSTE